MAFLRGDIQEGATPSGYWVLNLLQLLKT